MAYAPAIPALGPFAPLAVPPSRRMLARTVSPVSFDPQLGGFFDILTAPFRYGAKVVSTVAGGAYDVARYTVRKAPAAITGFAAGGPVGAAAAVGASIITDIHGNPIEVGYGDNTVPPYSGTAQGYGTPATTGTALRRTALQLQPTAEQYAAARSGGGFDTGALLKWAPVAVGAVLLLKR